MNIEELKKRKTDLGMTNRDLARKSGIPLSTVAKILGGTTKTPRIDTMQALEKALQCGFREDQKKAAACVRLWI